MAGSAFAARRLCPRAFAIGTQPSHQSARSCVSASWASRSHSAASRKQSSRDSIMLSQLRTAQRCGVPTQSAQAALRGSSRRSLAPSAMRNSCLTLAVHRICPAPTHLLAHFLGRLFAPGLAKRPTNFAAHATSGSNCLSWRLLNDLPNCRSVAGAA
jgi:hypothetical protein